MLETYTTTCAAGAEPVLTVYQVPETCPLIASGDFVRLFKGLYNVEEQGKHHERVDEKYGAIIAALKPFLAYVAINGKLGEDGEEADDVLPGNTTGAAHGGVFVVDRFWNWYSHF